MLTDWDAGAILRRAYDRASGPPEDTNGAANGGGAAIDRAQGGRNSIYSGIAKAFDATGKAVDAQNALTAALLGIVSRGASAADAIIGVDKALGAIGAVLMIGQQAFVAADEISKGVPADIAINGAAIHAGATIGGAVLAGAATGFVIGSFAGPPGEAIGGVMGGIAGAYGMDSVLPSNDQLGRIAR